MQPLVLIECPRLLFPFAREIVATSVRNGGFPPLLLDPIDFVALYQQRMAQVAPPPATALITLTRYRRQVLPPDRGLAQRRDERAVGVALVRRDPRRKRLRTRCGSTIAATRVSPPPLIGGAGRGWPGARRSARHRPRPAARRRAARRA